MDICLWQFPQEISQSTFNGCNGINACSLIFLPVAYIFFRNGIKIPDLGPLPHDIFRMLGACIELGNRGFAGTVYPRDISPYQKLPPCCPLQIFL